MSADLGELEEAVERLQHYSDTFVAVHGVDKVADKGKCVEQRLQQVLAVCDKYESAVSTVEERHRFCWLKGWALNVADQYCAQSEQLLTRATKLLPSHVPSWNQLGDCVWKKGDSSMARHCFTHALQLEENAVSLRQLSIVQRSGPAESAAVADSLQSARRAVQLDVRDGQSWTVLGNALLSYHFVVSPDPRLIDQCLAAYQRAETDAKAKYNPDLHFNRASCLRYAACYQQAISSLDMALALAPDWTLAQLHRQSLLHFVTSVDTMVAQRAKLKHRKLIAFTQDLARPRLGIYSDECTINKVRRKLSLCVLSELRAGVNEDKIVVGKVVGSLRGEHHTAFTFCMVDSDCDCVAVNVYNVASDRGFLIGDMIAIPQPHLAAVDVRCRGTLVSFRLLRVQTPVLLVVNGRRVSASAEAPITLSTTHSI